MGRIYTEWRKKSLPKTAERKHTATMNLLEILRKKDRTLLEMHIGMIFFGLVCEMIGLICMTIGSTVKLSWMPGLEQAIIYTISLWLGIAAAALAAWHIYRTLDRSLDYGESATKMIFKGYMIRYVLILLIMLIIIITEILNPLVVFLGYMSLKVTALIQPFTHKICNKIFHETDPEPQPMPEEGTAG